MIEAQAPEGSRLEVALHLAGSTPNIVSRLLELVIQPANRELDSHGVDPWPEETQIVSLDQSVIRIRWQKNPLWWSVIWRILLPLLLVALAALVIYLVFWTLARYAPMPVRASILGIGAILAIAGAVIVGRIVSSFFSAQGRG